MSMLYLVISLTMSGFLVETGNGKPASTKNVERNWQVDTNGLRYEIYVHNEPFNPPKHWNEPEVPAPVCWVYGQGSFTNAVFKHFLKMPPTNLFRIKLFDSKGNAVEKTPEGKMFGLPLSQEQVAKWFQAMRKKNLLRSRLYYFSHDSYAAGAVSTISYFSLRPAFRIKEPGEYTLHLQLRLIESKVDANRQFYFPMVWLPEVTARFEIPPGYFSPTNSVSALR